MIVQSCNCRLEFLLHSRVVVLCVIKLARKACHWFAFLHDDRSHLNVTGVSADMLAEGFVAVRMSNEDILGQQHFDMFGCLFMLQLATQRKRFFHLASVSLCSGASA